MTFADSKAIYPESMESAENKQTKSKKNGGGLYCSYCVCALFILLLLILAAVIAVGFYFLGKHDMQHCTSKVTIWVIVQKVIFGFW